MPIAGAKMMGNYSSCFWPYKQRIRLLLQLLTYNLGRVCTALLGGTDSSALEGRSWQQVGGEPGCGVPVAVPSHASLRGRERHAAPCPGPALALAGLTQPGWLFTQQQQPLKLRWRSLKAARLCPGFTVGVQAAIARGCFLFRWIWGLFILWVQMGLF